MGMNLLSTLDIASQLYNKFVTFLRVDSNGCWLYQGGKINSYGRFKMTAKSPTLQAHRYSYEVFKGEIAEGLVIDHLCRVKNCVNPDHLEAVTPKENTRRGKLSEYTASIPREKLIRMAEIGRIAAANKRKSQTHCKRGHEFTEDNTYLYAGTRNCKACRKARRERCAQ